MADSEASLTRTVVRLRKLLAEHHEEIITTGRIATACRVGRAAVSNWRKRWDDFPTPILDHINTDGRSIGAWFWRPEVDQWLRSRAIAFDWTLPDDNTEPVRAYLAKKAKKTATPEKDTP